MTGAGLKRDAWIDEYCRELLRTAGKVVRIAACGGGWYAMHLEGDESALKQRQRRSGIEEMTKRLAERPALQIDGDEKA